MVAGIAQKGKGPQPKLVAAAVEGAGQVRADEPRAPPLHKRPGHGP
jgi:hypothetical protein